MGRGWKRCGVHANENTASFAFADGFAFDSAVDDHIDDILPRTVLDRNVFFFLSFFFGTSGRSTARQRTIALLEILTKKWRYDHLTYEASDLAEHSTMELEKRRVNELLSLMENETQYCSKSLSLRWPLRSQWARKWLLYEEKKWNRDSTLTDRSFFGDLLCRFPNERTGRRWTWMAANRRTRGNTTTKPSRTKTSSACVPFIGFFLSFFLPFCFLSVYFHSSLLPWKPWNPEKDYEKRSKKKSNQKRPSSPTTAATTTSTEWQRQSVVSPFSSLNSLSLIEFSGPSWWLDLNRRSALYFFWVPQSPPLIVDTETKSTRNRLKSKWKLDLFSGAIRNAVYRKLGTIYSWDDDFQKGNIDQRPSAISGGGRNACSFRLTC